MKYRIQFKASFNNTDANTIINEIETAKDKVFAPDAYTPVPIIRKTDKQVYNEETEEITIYSSIDFDAESTEHTGSPSGIDLFEVDIDISFAVLQDYYDCINYLESIKDLADETKPRYCRHFVCNHDVNPIVKDGPYTIMSFTDSQLIFPTEE